MSDKGQIKEGIFFLAITSSIVFLIFLAIALSDMYATRSKNEKLEKRIQEQELLIEYLKKEEK